MIKSFLQVTTNDARRKGGMHMIVQRLMVRMLRIESGELYERTHLSAKEFLGKDAFEWEVRELLPQV